MSKLHHIFIVAVLILLQATVIAWGASPLTLTYAGGTGSGNSDSKFNENIWSYTYQYHVLVLTGDTPQGSLFSQIQVEERDRITGLAYAKLSLNGSSYALDIGDNVANFSDITLNSLSYQGASITLKPSSSLNFTVLGGTKGCGLWGAGVRRDNRDKENFTGLRTNYYPGGGLGLNTTYLTNSGGSQIIAYGGDYMFNDLKLNMEYGSAIEGKAFRGEIKYQNDLFNIGTIYRDVEPEYTVPLDYVSYKGMKGTYSTLGIRPFSNMSINMGSDSYIDRLNGDPDLTINDTRGDVSYNMSTGTSIGYSGWKSDKNSYDRGGVTEGEMMYITQQFYLLTRNAIYYRMQPSWFTSSSPSEESYAERKEVTGINIALLDELHLNYEIENTTRLLKTTDIKINPSAVSMRADLFETPIFGQPLYLSSSISYRKDIADTNSTAESVSLYEDLTLRYKPSQDFSCYITAKLFDMDSPAADRTKREQKDLSFGLNYTFNTLIFLK